MQRSSSLVDGAVADANAEPEAADVREPVAGLQATVTE
jgi:hypothetical protein